MTRYAATVHVRPASGMRVIAKIGDRKLRRCRSSIRAGGRGPRDQSPQQSPLPRSWIGGHGTVPYEQYTQQSPGLGLSTAWHCSHS